MMFIPINMSGGGNVSNKTATAMFVVANFVLLISFCVMYYLFMEDSYKGTFWNWSWDMDYFIVDESTKAGIGFIFFWMPFFVINGIAILTLLTEAVENIIFKPKH